MDSYPRPQNLPYVDRVLSSEGRFMRRSEVGQSESLAGAGYPKPVGCGARGCASQAWTRGALGNRPSPIRGSALNGWGVQVKGGRKPAWMASLLAPVPEARSQGRRSRRGGTLRGVAVCLCFSAIREISRGRYQGAPFGVPSPLMVWFEGRKDKSPTRAAARERRRVAV